MTKPILCLDFDGVIHSYESGWKGATYMADPPVPGVFQWMRRAQEFWDVQVYSSRTKEPGGMEAMAAYIAIWAREEGVHDLTVGFPEQKPAAFLTIDDRAICFDGDWAALDPEALLAFKPWNKR